MCTHDLPCMLPLPTATCTGGVFSFTKQAFSNVHICTREHFATCTIYLDYFTLHSIQDVGSLVFHSASCQCAEMSWISHMGPNRLWKWWQLWPWSSCPPSRLSIPAILEPLGWQGNALHKMLFWIVFLRYVMIWHCIKCLSSQQNCVCYWFMYVCHTLFDFIVQCVLLQPFTVVMIQASLKMVKEVLSVQSTPVKWDTTVF